MAALLIYTMPFIKTIILNGSFSSGNPKKSSDIDILIIAKSGRIFTVRFLSNLIVALLGLKRPKNSLSSHAGKFCLNYFLTEKFLKIPIGRGDQIDQYCAQNYSQSTLIIGEQKIFDKFLNANKELFLLAKPKREEKEYHDWLFSYFPITHSRFCRIAKEVSEAILNDWLGDKIEKILKKLQIRLIERDYQTIEKHPDLIVYNDRELRFHPPKKTVKNV